MINNDYNNVQAQANIMRERELKQRQQKALVGASEVERLGGFDFQFKRRKNAFGRRTRSKRVNASNAIKRKAISQADYEKLINFNVLSGDLESLSGIAETESTFTKFQDTGNIRREGEELSVLDQAGFDSLMESLSGRRAQIEGQAISPGLNRQAFSLLSGNFG